MLGKLARFLRFLGYDTLYRREQTVDEMLEASKQNNRIVVSSSRSIIQLCKKNDIQQIYLKSTEVSEQLKSIKDKFDLNVIYPPINMRCSVCNGSLTKRSKNEVINRILEGTAKNYEEFWECDSCSKIFWLGSHWEDIKKTIAEL